LPSSIDVAFVVSCDSPLIESAFVERLLALCLSSEDSDVVVPRDEHRHWLCAMYRRRILSDVESLLAAGERKMGALNQVLSVKEVAVETLRSADPKLLSLRNVNHPKDYLGVLETLGLTVDQEILRRLQAAQSQQ
jgi:molybdopterin-guanine dinucleotide biosynthesis protein A